MQRGSKDDTKVGGAKANGRAAKVGAMVGANRSSKRGHKESCKAGAEEDSQARLKLGVKGGSKPNGKAGARGMYGALGCKARCKGALRGKEECKGRRKNGDILPSKYLSTLKRIIHRKHKVVSRENESVA